VAILLAIAAGIGLLAGALVVKYRDIGHIIPTFLQLGLYITPVAWSTLMVPEGFRWVFLVNPLSGLLDAVRWSLLGEGALSPPMLCYSTATAGLVFWLGASVFKQKERNFADVI
jgi:lipopolysaccharide transport system permease protein